MKQGRGNRKLAVILVVVVVVVLTATFGYWKWKSNPPINLPHVDLTAAPEEMRDLIKDTQRAVVTDASSASWGNLGSALLANGFHLEAAQAFQQAAELEPGKWQWFYLQGISLDAGNMPGSVEAYEIAESLHRKYAPLYVRLASAYEDNGQLDAARENWQRVLELDRENYGAHLGLARLAFADGRVDVARDHAIDASELIPLQREAHILLSQIYLRLDDQQNLAQHKQQLAKCRPVKWQMRDEVLAKVQQMKIVHRFVQVATEADRSLRAGNLQEFITLSQQLIELQPRDPNPSVNLGMAIGDLGYAEEAISLLTRAVERFPHSSRAHYNLGVMMARTGQLTEAEHSLARALDLKPDFSDAHLLLGDLYKKQSNPGQAEQAYRQAIEVSPSHVGAHLSLAELLRELGRTDDAIMQFEFVMRLRPDDAKSQRALKELRQSASNANRSP